MEEADETAGRGETTAFVSHTRTKCSSVQEKMLLHEADRAGERGPCSFGTVVPESVAARNHAFMCGMCRAIVPERNEDGWEWPILRKE